MGSITAIDNGGIYTLCSCGAYVTHKLKLRAVLRGCLFFIILHTITMAATTIATATAPTTAVTPATTALVLLGLVGACVPVAGEVG